MEVVRHHSPHHESPHSHHDEDERRGRPKEKGKAGQTPESSLPRSKERFTLSKIGDMLKLDHDDVYHVHGWKEFRPGTYTYPISFEIPATSPATLQCEYGNVIWRLRAIVHRPGAFTSKLAVNREVIVITAPTEDDTDDSENIIVERMWESQLQYLISISGRSFYIGGTIPVSFGLLPLAKVKIYRFSIHLEGVLFFRFWHFRLILDFHREGRLLYPYEEDSTF
jgi:arrestin-related trafficking adapter 3/6